MEADPMRRLARSLLQTTFDDLPPEAVQATKNHLIHTIGTILAGSSTEGCGTVAELVTDWGGARQSHILVFGSLVPSPHAALVNSVMAEAGEFQNNDDRINYKSSVCAIPAALATAERLGNVSGKKLITAVCTAVDFGIRMGLAINPKPAHPSAPELGPFAVAAAAGKLMGLSEESLLDALGIAYTGVAISGRSTSSPSLTKRLTAGLAARNGVFAAELAAVGYPANRSVLTGKNGYFRLFHGEEGDYDVLLADLGRRFEIVEVGPKAYPSCRSTHAAVTATMNLVERYDIRPEQVEKVSVTVSRRVLDSSFGAGDPAKLEIKQSPRGVVDAQFSVPYTVARIIMGRKLGFEDFLPEALRDRRVVELARRVNPVLSEELDEWPMDAKPAIVDILLKDGSRFVERVEYAKGNPRDPISYEEILRNFRGCAGFTAFPIPSERTEKALELLERLENLEDVSDVVKLLSRVSI
ncbi:MAG: MmgE/PrpD family protein [Deltaproteobacteria bacterium]|nr:MmgE/PrpD family protein [Deltaproteobacteria bacterium]